MDIQGFWRQPLEPLSYFKNPGFFCQGKFCLKLAAIFRKGRFEYIKIHCPQPQGSSKFEILIVKY